jgi:hypothetical protein
MLDTKWSPATGNGGAEQADDDGNCDPLHSEISPDKQALLDDLAAARQHLEYRGEANIVIAEWRDELRTRIRRNRLRQELIGLPDEEHDALVHEVAEYKRLCAAIGWSPAGRRQ